MAAMFVGGMAGSTAGGIKVIRHIVLLKSLAARIHTILHPHAIATPRIDGAPIDAKMVAGVAGFLFLYAATLMAAALYLFGCGYDFLTAFSAAAACVGNVGPGFGHVGPADNFAFFTDTQKIVLSIVMIVGRLEFYTFIIILTPRFWKRF